jgi:hypothetical protein
LCFVQIIPGKRSASEAMRLLNTSAAPATLPDYSTNNPSRLTLHAEQTTRTMELPTAEWRPYTMPLCQMWECCQEGMQESCWHLDRQTALEHAAQSLLAHSD